MEKFIKRLKELRKEKGLTQGQLAKATGLSVSAISSWENNTRVPNILALIALAQFFEVSTDYMLGISDF